MTRELRGTLRDGVEQRESFSRRGAAPGDMRGSTRKRCDARDGREGAKPKNAAEARADVSHHGHGRPLEACVTHTVPCGVGIPEVYHSFCEIRR